jgi:ABC-2 type transport system permease protein
VRAIFWKELGDHFGKRRFNLMLGLVLVGVLWAMFVDKEAVVTGGTGSFYLDLFTTTFGVPISLLSFLSFFGPIIGITLGFDSINSERTQGTLSRILAQPVYRDAVYNGKFLAGIFTLTMVVFSLGIAAVGVAMFRFGLPPSSDEVLRLIGFGFITIAYLSFWLALAMTASIFLRNAVASALVSIGIWIGISFFIVFASSTIADRIVPDIEDVDDQARHANVQLWVGRVSPERLFSEATGTLLDPIGGRFLNPFSVAPERLEGLLRSPVSAGQSLQLVWPHIVVLIAMIASLMSVSYVRFMREEIRS